MPTKDPERRRAQSKEASRRYRERHPEKIKAYAEKYHRDHREICLARMKELRERKKAERKAYRKDFYWKNREKLRAKRDAVTARLRDISDRIKAERGCAYCEENDPTCLDFHHIDPSQKITHVSNLASGGVKLDIFLAEIAKCIVVCGNCHRIRHWQKKTGRLV